MGQFKPMVKMFTDEPSVILKLKKGGGVKAAGQADGFKSMHSTSGGNPFDDAEAGKSPKKPSMSARRKAMNPNQYAKGGNVAHKQVGGAMPVAAAMPAGGARVLGGAAPMGAGAPMRPMGRAAVAGMAPNARRARAAAVRRALMGMKKGGSTSAECAKLEKELAHHESMSAAQAHPMKKASGGAIDRAETRTTIESGAKKFAKTKMNTAHKDRAHGGTGEVKEGKPAGYKLGGTIEGNAGKFANTKVVDGDKADKAHGTGGVRMGNAGGFKHGGMAIKKASGGTIDSKMTRTTVEGGNWENRPANTSKPGKTNTKTGEVKEANAGGYKGGGSAKKAYATGGNVVSDGKAVKMPRHFVSKPVANSLQSGTFKTGGGVKSLAKGGSNYGKAIPGSTWGESTPMRLVKSHTGPKGHVAKVYKDRDWGEYRVKFFSPEGKHFPKADYHTDDLDDAHDTAKGQLGRYKDGGKAKGGYSNGGDVPADIADQLKTSENERAYRNWERRQTKENEADRSVIPSALRRMAGKVGEFFTSPKKPEGSVTETERSVTVAPAKKRGGLAR